MPEDIFAPKTDESWESQMVRDWLRKPFKPEQIGKLPATPKRPALDFVGHAAVTDRLNKIAPDWSYTVDTMSELNGKVWIRGTMTIGGVSRPEFGDGDDPKEAIGNFIRRGAMRFGVAIDLWSREELESSPAAGPGVVPQRPGVATTEANARPPQAGGTTSGPEAGGVTFAGRVPTPAQDPGPDPSPTGATGEGGPSVKSTSGSNGAEVAPEPGGARPSSPGSFFPMSPDECDHKTKNGRWLPTRQLNGVPVCPRCGMSAVLYRESA